jgi:hypothetical protein
VSILLETGLFGIDRDSTLIEKAIINHACNQTNRMLLVRILAKMENVSIQSLIDESHQMDMTNITNEIDGIKKYVKPTF